jgi:hypothetical protein
MVQGGPDRRARNAQPFGKTVLVQVAAGRRRIFVDEVRYTVSQCLVQRIDGHC